MNKIQNIVIVAGGKNTRFREMSIFPKILLPTLESSSILSYDCELFKNYNIYLIINDKYYNMVSQYINKTNLNITKLIYSFNCNGSANTIKAIIDQLPNNNVLFIWSDLILDKTLFNDIENSITNQSTNIIYTYNGEYRFKVKNNNIDQVLDKSGNVPGIYYIGNLESVFNQPYYPDDYDLIQIFQDNDIQWNSYPCEGNITEFRDLETYCNYYQNENLKTQTRFFNTMTIKDGILTKTCINPNYNKLLDRECLWYEKCLEYNYQEIPKVYNIDKYNHSISIEYLSGYENVYEFIKNSSDKEFNKFMKTYINAVEDLHNLFTKQRDINEVELDYWIEFYDKVVKRCNSISAILYNYDSNQLQIILSKAFVKILELSGKNIINYTFGHGDLNGSNVMYNKDKNDIKFIDPRGYFGNSLLLISPDYDYAKILYCLSGYDDFNNGRYKFTKDWYDEPKELKKYDFGPKQKLYYIMVGIIWVALAEYISQDVFKANIAYQHGIKILQNILNNE